MQKDVKRSVLTLGSVKKKTDNVFNISSASRELIAERQRKLKENQAKKNQIARGQQNFSNSTNEKTNVENNGFEQNKSKK